MKWGIISKHLCISRLVIFICPTLTIALVFPSWYLFQNFLPRIVFAQFYQSHAGNQLENLKKKLGEPIILSGILLELIQRIGLHSESDFATLASDIHSRKIIVSILTQELSYSYKVSQISANQKARF